MRFVIFGDSKGKDHGINKKVLRRILSRAKNLKIQPEYIIHLGDSVAGSSDIENLKFQMDELHKLIGEYYSIDKLLPIVGNHEVNNIPKDDKAEEIFEECYSNISRDDYLEGYHKTVYYKDFHNIRCIFLNTFHYGELHKITGRQLEWFKKACRCDIPFKIVFMHSPPYPTGAHLKTCLDAYPEERDNFWKVVEGNNIDLVVCGHEHNYSRREICSPKGKITQIITGGAGEKLKDSFKSKTGVIVPPKAVYHYLILDIEKENIILRAISTKNKLLDHFTIET